MFLVLLLLIPLLNLPLDWASLGLTRALLRRGCEAGARSPLLLGLVDFIAGLVLLLLLAALLVVGLQLADWVYLKASGRILLDVPGRLRAIGADPGAPVHYWIYLTLFSTVIPSVVNTVVGMSSLVTWSWRGRREWLLATIPTINNPDKLPRTKFDILTLLGVQASIGTFTALAALYGVFELGRFLLPDALPGFLRLMLWLAESLPP